MRRRRETPEQTAASLARWVRHEYDLPPQPSAEDLLTVCRERKVRVYYLECLDQPGYYLRTERGPLMVLRLPVRARVVAHELLHDLFREDRERGEVYAYTLSPVTREERVAQAFEEALCGSWWEEIRAEFGW